MAAGVVRAAIAAILEDRDFVLNTPRMITAKETAKKLIEASTADDHSQDTFVKFALSLDHKLDALATPSSSKKLSTQRKQLWSRFHAFRVSDLRKLWKKLYTSLDLDPKVAQDPLLSEYVNEKLFAEHVKTEIDVVEQQSEPAELMEDDLNALRYAAGFVPWKLRQKFQKPTCKHPNRKDYRLTGMSESAEEECEDTYMDYTKRWIRAIDRGGLFRITDEVYVFFHEVERLVRKFLLKLVTQDIEHSKKEIIDEVTSDNNVQFYWSMIAIDLDEDIGQELLVEIVQLWLTVRGFSTAGAFVEQYKQATKKSTKKSTSLRKGLKRKKLDMNSDD